MSKLKYPPSKYRYMEKNPNVTIVLPKEIKERIEEICREEGITKSQLLRNHFIDVAKTYSSLKEQHTRELGNLKIVHAKELEDARGQAYTKGYNRGKSDAESKLKELYEKDLEAARKLEREVGFKEGWRLGLKEGHELGYSEGHNSCISELKRDVDEGRIIIRRII